MEGDARPPEPLVDTSWWNPADLIALFASPRPRRILWRATRPTAARCPPWWRCAARSGRALAPRPCARRGREHGAGDRGGAGRRRRAGAAGRPRLSTCCSSGWSSTSSGAFARLAARRPRPRRSCSRGSPARSAPTAPRADVTPPCSTRSTATRPSSRRRRRGLRFPLADAASDPGARRRADTGRAAARAARRAGADTRGGRAAAGG